MDSIITSSTEVRFMVLRLSFSKITQKQNSNFNAGDVPEDSFGYESLDVRKRAASRGLSSPGAFLLQL